MVNEVIKPYNGNPAKYFVGRLLHGTEGLAPEQSVDAVLGIMGDFEQCYQMVRERIYQRAEEQQALVIGERTKDYQERIQIVEKTRKTGDLDELEASLEASITSCINVKEGVSKMKHIKNRGQDQYDPQKEMGQFVRKLDRVVEKNFGTGRGRPQLVEVQES